MRYLIAIFCPPLAVLLCGKPFQAIVNLFLCLLLWFPGMIHALLVAADYYSDRRNEANAEYMRQLAQWQAQKAANK